MNVIFLLTTHFSIFNWFWLGMSTKVVNIILIDNGVGTGESALGFVSKSMEQNNIAASTRKRYAGCVWIIKNWFHENEYEHRDVLFDDSENLLLITARNRDYYRRFLHTWWAMVLPGANCQVQMRWTWNCIQIHTVCQQSNVIVLRLCKCFIMECIISYWWW